MPEYIKNLNCCKHHRKDFLSSSHVWGGVREPEKWEVHICMDCGEFFVFTSKGGKSMTVNFNLVREEHHDAAGKYLSWLRRDEKNKRS